MLLFLLLICMSNFYFNSLLLMMFLSLMGTTMFSYSKILPLLLSLEGLSLMNLLMYSIFYQGMTQNKFMFFLVVVMIVAEAAIALSALVGSSRFSPSEEMAF